MTTILTRGATSVARLRPALYEQAIEIPGRAGPLEARLWVPQQSVDQPIVIICHPHSLYGGSMDNKVVTTLCQAFAAMAWPTIRFNFRGVGNSFGQFNGGVGESEDVVAMMQWAQQHFGQRQIWLAGFSFGAYVALKAHAQFPAQRLLLVAPPISLFDLSTSQLQGIHCSVIHGGADELIPLNKVQHWVHDIGEGAQLYCLDGASHFFHGRLNELNQLLKQVLAAYQATLLDLDLPGARQEQHWA